MVRKQDSGAVQNGALVLTAEEAKKKREQFLARINKEKPTDEEEHADSAIATFILPGD
jgi:hypothetical protein